MNVEWRPTAADLQTKLTDSAYASALGCYCLHPPIHHRHCPSTLKFLFIDRPSLFLHYRICVISV